VTPLMFVHGPGSASRFAIGLVVAAGLSIGTLFTLFVLPSVYLFLAPAAARERSDALDAVAEPPMP
jgi:multidrug efflux pump subunit AcrB